MVIKLFRLRGRRIKNDNMDRISWIMVVLFVLLIFFSGLSSSADPCGNEVIDEGEVCDTGKSGYCDDCLAKCVGPILYWCNSTCTGWRTNGACNQVCGADAECAGGIPLNPGDECAPGKVCDNQCKCSSTEIECDEINFYIDPTTVTSGQKIKFIATCDWGLTDVHLYKGDGASNCDFDCCENPTDDGKEHGWVWECTAKSVSSSTDFKVKFSGEKDDKTCYSEEKKYTVKPKTEVTCDSINLYVDPDPATSGQTVKFTATSDYEYKNVELDTSDGATDCGDVVDCGGDKPDSNDHCWRWTCKAVSVESPESYKAIFSGKKEDKSCSKDASYSVEPQIPPISLKCEHDQISVGQKNNCSITNCEEGLWIITNKEGKPLKTPIVEDIPPLQIEFGPAEVEGKIWTRAICFEPFNSSGPIKEHFTEVKKDVVPECECISDVCSPECKLAGEPCTNVSDCGATVSTFTIQGYKRNCPDATKITLDDTEQTIDQPYHFYNVPVGTHMVSLELPSGSSEYDVSYSTCDCCTEHPDDSFVSGNSHSFTKDTTCYYDLYWKCEATTPPREYNFKVELKGDYDAKFENCSVLIDGKEIGGACNLECPNCIWTEGLTKNIDTDIYCVDDDRLRVTFSDSNNVNADCNATHKACINDDCCKAECYDYGCTNFVEFNCDDWSCIVDKKFEMSGINCDESKCTLSIEKNTMLESVDVILQLIDGDGVIYYNSTSIIEKGSVEDESIYLEEKKSCSSGTVLEALVLAYRHSDEEYLGRLKGDGFTC